MIHGESEKRGYSGDKGYAIFIQHIAASKVQRYAPDNKIAKRDGYIVNHKREERSHTNYTPFLQHILASKISGYAPDSKRAKAD